MSLLNIFDDEDGDVGVQMKSDDLRTMRAVHVTYIRMNLKRIGSV